MIELSCIAWYPRHRVAALLLLVVAMHSGAVSGQDLEPRAYSNAPVGLNFVVAGFAYTDGGVAFDPALPLTDGALETQTLIAAYARTLDAWGRSAKFDVTTAASSLSGSASYEDARIDRDISGATDARFRFTLNLLGAPAMTPQQFGGYHQDLNLGASVQVTVPAGQYDASRLINVGTNRWSVKGELGLSKSLGPWTLELMPAVVFYTDNDDFFGGRTLSQDPVYSLQGHIVYVFRRGMWVALDGTWFKGGRTSTDGVPGDTEFDNTRAGATIALPVNRRHSLKLYASTGTATRTGSDYDAYGLAWQYRWGAGL